MMINFKQMYMKRIMAILSFFLIACSNNVLEANKKNEHELHDATPANGKAALQLNNGARWKTDDATRNNVAAMMKVINDNSADAANKMAGSQLAAQLQLRIDTLVAQCKMKGPEHEALHVWLEGVLHTLKELREADDEYQNSYAALRTRVESFYTYFE